MPTDTHLCDISPELATGWLRNYWCPLPEPWPYFREKGRELVVFFADQMTRGRWQVDAADPIKLTGLNELIDGRARLLAVRLSGLTVPMTIAGGHDYADWFEVHKEWS